MWNHLTSGDLTRAKQEIERRRDETTERHAEETKSLATKHAEEMQALNAKLAEIGLLDGLIDVFIEEFNPQAVHSEATHEVTEVPAADNIGESIPQISEDSPDLVRADAAEASNPGPLQVLFPSSPNFRAFRRIG